MSAGPAGGRLDGKVALVSGGAHGIGEAIVTRFVEEGARVAIGDVDVDAARRLADRLGPDALAVELDVASEQLWAAAVAATVARFGSLTVAVNDAGVVHHASLEDTTLEDYERVVRVNQIGTFLGMRAVVAPMRAAGGGSIVNVSSVRGLSGANGLLAYVASKFAVRGMTKVAAIELGEHGIRVNSIHPGAVASRLAAGIDEEQLAAAFADQPIPRIGRPVEIAELALFLASDESSYSTGSEFVADGGVGAGVRRPPR